MAEVYRGRDRVQQSSTTATAGGTINLTGLAPAGSYNFRDLYANGSIVALELEQDGVFECSYGTLVYGAGDASTDSVTTRTTTFSSSGIGATITWGAGTRNAWAMVSIRSVLLMENALSELAGRESAARGHLGLGSAALLDASVVVQFATGAATMVFYQDAAPTGWTKSTAQNDKALRVVSGGTGGTAGGTRALSSATVGSTTLTESHMPSHVHQLQGWTGAFGAGANVSFHYDLTAAFNSIDTGLTGGGTGHDHALALAYADVIICTKN